MIQFAGSVWFLASLLYCLSSSTLKSGIWRSRASRLTSANERGFESMFMYPYVVRRCSAADLRSKSLCSALSFLEAVFESLCSKVVNRSAVFDSAGLQLSCKHFCSSLQIPVMLLTFFRCLERLLESSFFSWQQQQV